MCVNYVCQGLSFNSTKTVLSSRRMYVSPSSSPNASFLPSMRSVYIPKVREPLRFVVAEDGESGGMNAAHEVDAANETDAADAPAPDRPGLPWHTVRRDSDGLVPSRIERVQAVASPDGTSHSWMQERTGSAVRILIPERDLSGIQDTVCRSYERMQILTKRLLAVGPHRLPEFKAAKVVRDDLKRLCHALMAKTRTGDSPEK